MGLGKVLPEDGLVYSIISKEIVTDMGCCTSKKLNNISQYYLSHLRLQSNNYKRCSKATNVKAWKYKSHLR